MLKVKNVIHLDVDDYGRPPSPTANDPLAQIKWIFDKRRDRHTNKHTRSNYQGAKTFFLEHIKITEEVKPYFLAEEWDEFVLLKFKGKLEERIDSGNLQASSHSLTGLFSSVRQVMKEAASYGLLGTRTIHETNWGSAFSETDAHSAYSDQEITQIINAIGEELKYSNAVASEYKRQAPDQGKDPRKDFKRGAKNGYGFGAEANMRWYFENVLGCNAITGVGLNKREHNTFLNSASNLHGGLHTLYRRWGVSAFIDENLLMPLAVKLILLTGLNPSSLLGLQVDCLRDEHPLTGMSYLLFKKERSGGEKELHLPLLEKREERSLKRKQTLLVKRAVNNILFLTNKIRDRVHGQAPLNTKLFIYQSTGPRSHDKVKEMTGKQTSAWCKRIVEKYDLTDDSGHPLLFNLVRFRSTKLTEMALEGRDLFEIQQVARHKSITQTVRYIAANRLDVHARAEVSKALEKIRANQNEVATKPSKVITINSQPSVLYKGIIADCKNVFDPPDRVKRAVDYVQGQACTRFNMCLFCRNVVVLKEHLPALAAYRAQIMAVQANNIQNLPHAHLYNQTQSLLDNLLDPNVSQFSSDDIKWALDMVTAVDIVVDPLLYRGAAQ